MSRIAGGRFIMGSDRHYAEERPAHPVTVNGFWIDTRAVTNAEFAAFVAATGYVTLAGRPLDPALYPDALPELAVPGALVFRMTSGPVDTRDLHNWWHYVPGASWHRPEGPGSDLAGRDDHPVVHVAFEASCCRKRVEKCSFAPIAAINAGICRPGIPLESAEFSATFRRPIACARSLRATAP